MNGFDDSLALEDLLERFRSSMAEEIHTAMPGRVESYDAAAQVADVTPMVRRSVPRADGSPSSETMPTIRAVPIVWPRAGAWFVHMPLAPGDFVLLVMCERDPARWRVTGELSDPIDRRAHHLAHAVAIPGVYPRTRQLSAGATPSDALVVGRDGGATIRVKADGVVVIDSPEIRLGSVSALDFVALASKVAVELGKIAATLATGSNSGGPVVFSVPYVPASTAATRARAE